MTLSDLLRFLEPRPVRWTLIVLAVLFTLVRLALYLAVEDRFILLSVLDVAFSLLFALGGLWIIYAVYFDRLRLLDEKTPAKKFDQDLLFLAERALEVFSEPTLLVSLDLASPHRIFAVNRHITRLTGYDENELKSMKFRDLFAESSRPAVLEFDPVSPSKEREVEVLAKDGTTFSVMLRYVILPTRISPHAAIILRDLSERKIREARQVDYTSRLETMVTERTEALLQTERQLISLMESMDSIVLSLDKAGKITYVNPAWNSYLGHETGQTIGLDAASFMHPEDAERFARLYGQSITEKINMSRLEFRCRAADGTHRILSGTLSLVKDLGESIEGSVMAMADITDQRRMQEWITHTERMESMGLLASGLAHDFNNLFQEMMGLTRRIKQKAGAGTPITADADSIELIVERATAFVRKQLSFASSGEKNVERLDINDSIRRIHKLVGRNLPPDIALTLELESCQQVEGDPTQFDQVFLNLILNARDAIEGVGEITLRSSDIIAENHAPFPINSPGNGRYVVVECRDTGKGMTPQVRQRIFDPFFTTKPEGRGMGLGLPTVYGIIKSHGGVISVESEPGEGTLFTLLLPARAATTEIEIMPEPTTPSTVLLVDDDRDIAHLTAEAFQYEGFRVLVAYSGREALDTYQVFSREIDVVVMDKRMPEMDGLLAARQMRQINPDCKIVVSSGERIGDDHGLGHVQTRFLEKPYQFDRLLEAVNRLLRRHASSDDVSGNI